VACCATLVLLVGGLFAGCASTAAGSGSADTQETRPISAAEREARSERIRAYFAAKAKRFDVVATSVTPSGQTLDWIRPESQVDGGRLAKPPLNESARLTAPEGPVNPFLGSTIALRQLDRSAQTEVQDNERLRGPAGTVPIVRFDVERYLRDVEIPPRDPAEVLTKMPPPAPASNDRYYAVWQRYGTFFGTAGRINIWDTNGPVGNETSIAQTAVIRGTPMQAIEAGKIELQSLNGNRAPHFFTYYRTNGTASGDWVAGYNTLVDGWIQVSSRVAPGMSIAAWNSRTGGDQFSLDVEVRLHEGNWWVWVAGEWAGYYPHCIGGGAAPCFPATASVMKPPGSTGSAKSSIRPHPRPRRPTWAAANSPAAGSMPRTSAT
jgi:hypothetical protein